MAEITEPNLGLLHIFKILFLGFYYCLFSMKTFNSQLYFLFQSYSEYQISLYQINEFLTEILHVFKIIFFIHKSLSTTIKRKFASITVNTICLARNFREKIPVRTIILFQIQKIRQNYILFKF